MRFRQSLFILLGIFFCFSLVSSEARADLAYDVALTKRRVRIDETVKARVLVTWPKEEGAYTLDIRPIFFRNFELINEGESLETFRDAGKDLSRKTFILELKPLAVGTGAIEPFTLSYKDSTRGISGAYQIEEVLIPIEKAPLPVKRILGIATGCVFLLLPLFFFFIRKRKSKRTDIREESLEDQHLKNIERINPDDSRPNYKESLFSLDKEFRLYLQNHYRVQVNEDSKEKAYQSLEEKGVSREEQESLKNILSQFEQLKFQGENIDRFSFSNLKREAAAFIKNRRVIARSEATK